MLFNFILFYICTHKQTNKMENQKKLMLYLELLEKLANKLGINESRIIIQPSNYDILKEENRIIASQILDIKKDILSIFETK